MPSPSASLNFDKNFQSRTNRHCLDYQPYRHHVNFLLAILWNCEMTNLIAHLVLLSFCRSLALMRKSVAKSKAFRCFSLGFDCINRPTFDLNTTISWPDRLRLSPRWLCHPSLRLKVCLCHSLLRQNILIELDRLSPSNDLLFDLLVHIRNSHLCLWR